MSVVRRPDSALRRSQESRDTSMARKNTTKTSQPARQMTLATKVLSAMEMRLAGEDWESIARKLDIRGGKGAVYNLVNNALKRSLRERGDELRELEARRLDKLMSVYWPKAMDGDGWSMDRCLRLMERRAALLGIDVKPDVGAAAQHYTKRIILEEISPAA